MVFEDKRKSHLEKGGKVQHNGYDATDLLFTLFTFKLFFYIENRVFEKCLACNKKKIKKKIYIYIYNFSI